MSGRLRIGVDTGGTFVDCVVVGPGGTAASKALSPPESGVEPILSALARAAQDLDLTLEEMLGDTSSLVYGTTVGLNAVLTRSGKEVGLLATRGHEDAIRIGRVHQKVAGLSLDEMTAVASLRKPPPLVPRHRIVGVDERVDSDGRVVVALQEDRVLQAVGALVTGGCRSLAVAYLWSFKNPVHEERTAELIDGAFPDVTVTLSSVVAPTLGEYERTAAAVMNAYLGDVVSRHVQALERELVLRGFGGRLLVMESAGGVASVDEVGEKPVLTLTSGPVGGVMATASPCIGGDRAIAADMGGTSFDVGLVVGGEPQIEDAPVVAGFHVAVPSLKSTSIGAGGGSIAGVDRHGLVKVGPDSAGAYPGPACFGRGGTAPTVTDADLVLGRLDPAAHPDPSLKLGLEAATKAVGTIAAEIGVTVEEAAQGIVDVADAQMADLVRKTTLEAGHDPRRLRLVAYGGAAPVHVGGFARDAGVSTIVVPKLASVFSALGLAGAAWRRMHLVSDPQSVPLDPLRVSRIVERLIGEAREAHDASGVGGELQIELSVDMRYARQTHVVTTPFETGEVDVASLGRLVDRFEQRYEEIFGRGTGYREAGIEAILFRAIGATESTAGIETGAVGPGGDARTRAVYFGGWIETAVLSAESVVAGAEVMGPALIQGLGTTLVVHPGQRAYRDDAGLLHMEIPS